MAELYCSWCCIAPWEDFLKLLLQQHPVFTFYTLRTLAKESYHLILIGHGKCGKCLYLLSGTLIRWCSLSVVAVLNPLNFITSHDRVTCNKAKQKGCLIACGCCYIKCCMCWVFVVVALFRLLGYCYKYWLVVKTFKYFSLFCSRIFLPLNNLLFRNCVFFNKFL